MKKLFLVLLLMVLSLPAYSQSMRSLQEEIDTLREDITVLQRKAYSGESGGASGVAQVGELDENVRDVIGRMDVLEHRIKTLEGRIDLINKDVDVRLKMMEGKPIDNDAVQTAPVSSVNTFKAPVAVGAPASVVGDSIAGGDLSPVAGQSVEELYQRGLEELKANENEKAEVTFSRIISQYPQDKLAGNAQYWLGEAYYGKKDYEQAAIAFAKGYQNYKDGVKGADSLFKLGMSMESLKKNPEACAAFKSLPKEFPKSSQDLKTKAKNEATKLKCK